MSTIAPEIAELKNLLNSTASTSNIERAKLILNRLQQIDQKPATPNPAMAPTPEDQQHSFILEKLHETQEELLACTLQNAALLNLLSECYEVMEKSASITDQLVLTTTR